MARESKLASAQHAEDQTDGLRLGIYQVRQIGRLQSQNRGPGVLAIHEAGAFDNSEQEQWTRHPLTLTKSRDWDNGVKPVPEC